MADMDTEYVRITKPEHDWYNYNHGFYTEEDGRPSVVKKCRRCGTENFISETPKPGPCTHGFIRVKGTDKYGRIKK